MRFRNTNEMINYEETEKYSPDWQQRTSLLVGDEGIERLGGATVAVIGLGGVGAFAAEMLARAGVGCLIIADSDQVSDSNKNRQLLALDSTMGKNKCDVMASRIRDINDKCNVVTISEYLTEESVGSIISGFDIDYLIDAIDTLSPKLALMEYCVNNGVKIVSSMGSGAKFDATKVRLSDLSKSYNCPLAYIIRKKLRKRGISKGIKVVFSEELPVKEAIIPVEERNKKSQTGTISYLPAVFGCVCAQAAIDHILKKE